MNCPYCNKEMEKGTLRSRGGVFFLPDGETVPKLFTEKAMAKHNAVILPPNMLSTKPEFPIAYICSVSEYDSEYNADYYLIDTTDAAGQ